MVDGSGLENRQAQASGVRIPFSPLRLKVVRLDEPLPAMPAIQDALAQIEAEQGVRTLFAVDSGSRAWGFECPDSDYDVRFVYVHPVERYLSIWERRDVIEAELPGDLDLAGWDLRKALGLLSKSNPSLFEWLGSPIVYAEDAAFMAEFRPLAAAWLSPLARLKHYVSMAQGNWTTYLQGDKVARKKYLYVLRPVLAARWIERGWGAPPTPFTELRAKTLDDSTVGAALDRLLADKARNVEMSLAPRDSVLHAFLDSEIERLAALPGTKEPRPDPADLDAFFRRWIGA